MLSIIVAMTPSGVIGDGNRLPWHCPLDLKRSKDLAMGKSVVFGRRTWEAICALRPGSAVAALPGRFVKVVTRNRKSIPILNYEDGHVGPARLENIIALHGSELSQILNGDEIMVAGGAEVYAQVLPHANRIYLTTLDAEIPGSVRFPPWDRSEWRVLSSERCEGSGENAMPHTFEVLERGAPS